MSNKEIVDEYIKSGLLKECINYQFEKSKERGIKQWKNDMFDDLVVILYTYDTEKLLDAHNNNHMNALITRIIQNQIFSTTSPFYKLYRKFDLTTTEITAKMADTYGE